MPDYTPYPVEVVTPTGISFDGDAQLLVVQGVEGQLGVLANHAPLISLLEPGEIRITDAEGSLHRFAGDQGYLQVRDNRALVLVSETVAADQIDAGQARSRLQSAEEALERARAGDGDLHAATREARFAEALVKTSA